ncbi:nitrate reductase NiaD [Aspergillus tanneri]|uniref:Nitrate reductase [NADPH] n=1 Tax=Aspergillus tanneri TaxID=1220188 RepID=A0A5M9N2E7_9EURO|nr:uncharacterized protein ATNIH1004_000728 [Aspergillus tanneri]KAA8651830.1 hypothetical protein ATNIH1004_000728 [Aspergillus tanneri]
MTTVTEVRAKAFVSNDFPFKSTAIKIEEEETSRLDLQDIPLPPPSKRPTEVLSIDKGTPDHHVARDPRLLRLTGIHPFNVEPPLTDLYKEGFLTSPELFYVRNHGPVPHVKNEDIPNWELSIEGRKEQNIIRKSKGFSWGSAALSTALFTGPLLSDILRSAKPLRKAKYPNGYYGTSVKLNWAMDHNRGIMLAHKMNGESLRPDHGRPLRAVVPGQIGGRSVKWLTKLILTDAPSDNWYHINDNRVLPTMVSPEMASNDPKWWRDDRYAIYDLNVNSSVVYPENNEVLDISLAGPSYTVRGYAYAGGGRRVTRVEISLDKGKCWRLADIHYAEDKYRDFEGYLYGGRVDMSWRETCFCWCFWSLSIAMSELENSDAILVRAMDESLSIQPRDMYWSVLGMMNNPWFRVTITKENGTLKFEHPTHPTLPGGWMERVKKSGGNLLNGNWGEIQEGEEPVIPEPIKEINMKKDGLKRWINLQEFQNHASDQSPWFVVNGEVYDGTAFLEGHPGGAQSIISSAGLDVSQDFLTIHSETAKAMMPDYHLGTMDKASLKALNTNTSSTSDEQRSTFLQSRSWTKARFVKKTSISWDTRIFTFQLEHERQTLGLPIGQHLMLKVSDTSSKEAIIRSYTPISESSKEGSMDLLVKIYFESQATQGGKMTTALDRLPLGSTVECKGPTGRFEYLGNGKVLISGKERRVRSFIMICGGTGITPIFQVLRAVIQDQEDPTSCVVLNGNRQEEDILCKNELDAFEASDNNKCKVVHTLTKASVSWTGHRGRISEDILEEYVVPSEENMVLVCGPETMENSVRQILLSRGWREQDLHFF